MGKSKILIVEGKGEIRESLEWLLQQEGFEVFTAENAGAAFDLLRAFEPDLVLTDLMMPLVAGEDFIRALQHQLRLAATPIVVLTAYCDVFGENAKAAGATEVLCKPRDIPYVVKTIRNLLGQRGD